MMPSSANNKTDKRNHDKNNMKNPPSSQRRLFDNSSSTVVALVDNDDHDEDTTTTTDRNIVTVPTSSVDNDDGGMMTRKRGSIERFLTADANNSTSMNSKPKKRSESSLTTTVVVGRSSGLDAVVVTPDVAVGIPNKIHSSSKRQRHSRIKNDTQHKEWNDNDDDVVDGDDDVDETNLYVPTHIHKNVGYISKSIIASDNKVIIDSKTKIVYDYICTNFNIPNDIEYNLKLYGPLSGTSYEDRIIHVYTIGKLQPKKSNHNKILDICIQCTKIGHKRNDCPTLI